jgi:hypothetical protein
MKGYKNNIKNENKKNREFDEYKLKTKKYISDNSYSEKSNQSIISDLSENSGNNINFWDDEDNNSIILEKNIQNSNKKSKISSNIYPNSQSSQTRINNEIEALSCIYLDEIEKIKYNPKGDHEFIINLKPNSLNSTFIDPICSIKLIIKYNKGYPVIAPGIDILEKYNLTKNEILMINENIDKIANLRSNQNCEMLNDIFDFIQKFLDEKSKSFQPFKKKEENYNISPRKMSYDINEFRNSQRKNAKRLSYNKGEGNDLLGNNLNDNYHTTKFDIGNMEQNFELSSEDIDMCTANGKSRLVTDFTIIEKIGEGGEGSVFKVKNNFDGMLYAIKKVYY